MLTTICLTEYVDYGIAETGLGSDPKRAILVVIGDYKDIELTEADFTLYDHIDSSSLGTLFRHDAETNAVVMFSVDDGRVHLWEDSGVGIRATVCPDDELFPPETA